MLGAKKAAWKWVFAFDCDFMILGKQHDYQRFYDVSLASGSSDIFFACQTEDRWFTLAGV